MKHTYSFSLTGNNPRYTQGVDANYQALKDDFNVVIHIDSTVLVRLPDSWRVITHPVNKSSECHFWRFETAGDKTLEMVHVRDIDSVVTQRERDGLERVGTRPYCMRDHYWHTHAGGAPFPVQGGLWGVPPKVFPFDMTHLVQWWIKNKAPFERYADMWFLNRYVYPYILRNGLQLDGAGSHWGGIPFPSPRNGNSYLGEVMWP